jgi:hypothetical protein
MYEMITVTEETKLPQICTLYNRGMEGGEKSNQGLFSQYDNLLLEKKQTLVIAVVTMGC